jgi:hypothetical protein
MCGRFTLTWDQWRRVAATLGIDDQSEVAASNRPRFNLAPTDEHFIRYFGVRAPESAASTLGLGESVGAGQPPRRSMHQRQG